MHRAAKNLSCQKHTLPAKVKQWTLCLLVLALILQTSFLFMVYLGTFKNISVFSVGVSLSKMIPKYSAEVLSSVSKCKKAAMCLTEKICVIG